MNPVEVFYFFRELVKNCPSKCPKPTFLSTFYEKNLKNIKMWNSSKKIKIV